MSKWIAIESPGLPAHDVAAEVLHLRMQAVEHYLPLAAHKHRRDVEHVHQLRVSCRRAEAALIAFKPLLPRNKRLGKWLKRIRRAAGPARDADVLLARLKLESSSDWFCEYLVDHLEHHREEVQDAIQRVELQSHQRNFQRCIKKCVASAAPEKKSKKAEPIGLFARQTIVSANQAMLQQANFDDASIAELHSLRIAGKRLRYAIELFHSVLPAAVRKEAYPLVEEIQSRLGQMNDHATAQQFFQDWMSTTPADERGAGLAERILSEHALLQKSRAEFLQWWSTSRVAQLESTLQGQASKG